MSKGHAVHASTLRRRDGHLATVLVSRIALAISLAALGVVCYQALRLLP